MPDFKSVYKKFTGEIAEEFDSIFSGVPSDTDIEILKKYLPANSKVLDPFCGTGKHVIWLAKNNYRVVATDYSKEMLAVTRKKLEREGLNVTCKLADATELPFESGSFDAAICLGNSIGAFLDKQELDKLIKELKRVTNEKGVLILDSRNRMSRWFKLSILKMFGLYKEGILMDKKEGTVMSGKNLGDLWYIDTTGRTLYHHIWSASEIISALKQNRFSVRVIATQKKWLNALNLGALDSEPVYIAKKK